MDTRPKLEDITLKPGQVLKARIFNPLDPCGGPNDWFIRDPLDLALVLVLQERHEGLLYNTSYTFLTIVDDIRVVEVCLESLQRNMHRLKFPIKWYCSNCKFPLKDIEMDKPCPNCYRLLGVDVDLYCEHGLAIDMACDKCPRGGFRFEGFNHGE